MNLSNFIHCASYLCLLIIILHIAGLFGGVLAALDSQNIARKLAGHCVHFAGNCSVNTVLTDSLFSKLGTI